MKETSSNQNDSYDDRMKRFWHYWNMKNATEEMIETALGELRIIIDALADYHDLAMKSIEEMEGYQKAAWEYQLERIKEIQKKLEQSIGYDRDKQIEICKKKRKDKEGDIGEDALILAMKKSAVKKEEKKKMNEANDIEKSIIYLKEKLQKGVSPCRRKHYEMAISAMEELLQYRERIEQLKRTEVRRFECKLPDGRICHFSDFIEFLESGVVE